MENIEFCEELLRTVLGKTDLIVVEATPQLNIRNIKGRSVIVDVLCKDQENKFYNIEIQKSDNDDHQKRVRYNGSNVDTYISEKGTKFSELPDVYVIYISTFDVFKQKKTVYHIDRTIRECGIIVENGFHEIYVNCEVDDKSDLAELMKLYKSSEINENNKFPVTCETIRNFKEGKGREDMCEIVERYAREKAEEAAKETTREVARTMIEHGDDYEYISLVTKLSVEEIENMAKAM